MMEQKKLLIATSNSGKFEEIAQFLRDLPFDLVNLKDLSEKIPEPEENGSTILINAVDKAKYYAEKTGLMSLADDSGLFIDAFAGWPGVTSARIAGSDESRLKTVLEKMEGISNRNASFKSTLALYSPQEEKLFVASGETDGVITGKIFTGGINKFGFNPIFYVEEMKKVYSEMNIQEKNSMSHRGKALFKVKNYLQNQYGAKNIVVPVGLIIKDGKILSNLRNDPHRPEYHRKWEFPGGAMEFGEKLQDNLVREIKEETGYEVEVVKLLQQIYVRYQPDLQYQVYLIPHICKIISGDGKYSDAEVLEMRFFELDELLDMDLLAENHELYEKLLPEIREIIKEYKL